MDMQRGEFSTTQRGKRVLTYLGYLYNKNKSYKSGDTNFILWECERRREMRCSVYVTTDEEGSVVKPPTSLHIHAEPGPARAAMLNVRHNLLEECQRRPEACPAALLNEFVTPDVAPHLPSERSLKRAIQRKRKHLMPIDPMAASNIVVADSWRVTLEGQAWYLGDVRLNEDSGYIFTTESNLSILQVRAY
jgi:FLYWCH zinc finger domain